MTKNDSTPSIVELLAYVANARAEFPESKKLKSIQANLVMGAGQEKKMYVIPILGVGIMLMGVYSSISSGDWADFGVTAVIGGLAILAFFLIRIGLRWELRRQRRKIKKLIAELADQSIE